MKKLVALAIAGAFVAPVYAEISITGSQEFSYTDDNGNTEFLTDSNILIRASTETAGGLRVSASLPIDTTGTDARDGSHSLTLGGPFGTLALGDVAGAADRFDGRADFDLVGGPGTNLGGDASVGWTLPALVEGLTVYVSHQADQGDNETTSQPGTGLGLQYVAGPVAIAYAQDQNDDAAKTKVTYVGATVKFGGLAVSLENQELNTGVAATIQDQTAVGLSYSMGDLRFNLASQKNKLGPATASDVTFYQVRYTMGGGVSSFVETSTDADDASATQTSVGVIFAF